MKKYIHYGDKHFDPKLFMPIKNRYKNIFTKPFGGLWASSVDSTLGWKEWNEINDFMECDDNNSFKFTLKEGSRVLTIDSNKTTREEILVLPRRSFDEMTILLQDYPMDDKEIFLDFEALANVYDAIELVGIKEFDELWHTLYGWDCECILVLNPDCIEEIS